MTSFRWLIPPATAVKIAAGPIVQQVAAHLLSTVVASHRPGFGWRTGTLAGSYTATPAGDGWEVGTGIYYAPFVEYGTRYMAAQSHLRRAAAATAAAFPGVTWSGG